VTETTLEALRQAGLGAGSPEHMPDYDYLTTDELAAVMRTSPETCRYWRHIGRGPRSFKAGRKVLYARADVLRWLEELQAGGTPGAA
jgi:hypothetical protein